MALTLPRKDPSSNTKGLQPIQIIPQSVQQLSNTFVRPFKSLSLKDLAVRPKGQNSYNRREYLDAIKDQYKRLVIVGNGDINLLEENPHYQALMRQRFFDPSVLSRVEQALYMFTNDGKYEDPTQFDATTGILIRELVHHIFKFNRQIGSDSAYGMAYTFGTTSSNDTMVVKYSTNQADLNEIYHEWIMGYMLNHLRTKIPNFVYTLGCLVGCSPPISYSRILSPVGRVASWCSLSDREGKTPYLLLERIYDPIPFDRYLLGRNEPGNLINFILQISLSLYLANQEFRFTHYDLHGGNVLCWSLPDMSPNEPIVIPYSFLGKTLFLKTYMIASIIDMGFARGEYEGYKYHNAVPEFRNYDRFYGLTDIFRLITHLYTYLQDYEQYNLIPYLTKMLSFFTDEDPHKVISTCIETKCFNLPPNDEIERLDCSFFVAFLLQTFKLDFVSWEQPAGIRILGCNGTDVCIRPGTSPICGPIDKHVDSLDPVILFYLYANKGIRSFTLQHMERAIIGGNHHMNDELNRLEQEVTVYTTQFGNDREGIIPDLFNVDQMVELYRCIVTLFSIYDRYQYMTTYIRAIYYIDAIYFPSDEESFYQFYRDFRDKYDPFFDRWKRTIHREMYAMWNQSKSSRAIKIIRRSNHDNQGEIIKWYQRSLTNITEICVNHIPPLVRHIKSQ